MKLHTTAAVLALSATLLTTGCSGDDESAGKGDAANAAESTATAQQKGERTRADVRAVGDATVEVKGAKAYLIGVVRNEGSADVKLTSVVPEGFSLAAMGTLKDDRIAFIPGGLPIRRGEERRFGTTGEVVQFEYPNGTFEAGTTLRIELNFDDYSKSVVEATLSDPIEK